jgi:hypothetical protein
MVRIVSLAERGDLEDAMWRMPNEWPTFMLEDPVADRLFGFLPRDFPDYQLVAVDDGAVVGKLHMIPFRWAGTVDDLPVRGWDAVLERGFADYAAGLAPTAVSLLEARLVRSRLGSGLATDLLLAAKRAATAKGLADLFGPVRPTRKSAEPHTSMAEYVARTRDDGLPADPWLRTHVRLGGQVVKVCPASMTIPGSLAQWRSWTGLPLDTSGPVAVPGALVPVQVSVEHDYAVYVEPNVWVRHRL